MQQVFGLMAFYGAMTFLMMGICLGVSIEAKESKRAANFMSAICGLGFASFVIGGLGLTTLYLIK